MSEFWYTRGTMSDLNPDYICFEHFSPVHLALTAAFTAIIIAAMMFYKKLDEYKVDIITDTVTEN